MTGCGQPWLALLRALGAAYWNPIGIPMELERGMEGLEERPLPDDEYDNYLAEVREMLFAGAADADVVAYLDEVEREFMGIDQPHGDKCRFVAEVRAAISGGRTADRQ